MSKKKTEDNWKCLATEQVYGNSYFHLRIDKCETFDGKIMPKYYVVDFPDWVQVVALTNANELIVVNQYRYAGGGWFLEFPGGSTHPDRNEDPLTAAKRELREETGYESDNWSCIGYHYPNPALLNNKCHVYIARDCKKNHIQELDPFEVLEVKLMGVSEFENSLTKADRTHALMLATYAMVRENIIKG